MKKLLVSLALTVGLVLPSVAVPLAIAEANVDGIHVSLTLTDEACRIKPPDEYVELRHAEFKARGRGQEVVLAGCYLVRDGVVLVAYEDGDEEAIPQEVFRLLKTV